MGFTDQFTNTLIAPVNKRYRLITLTADTDLVWPIESATSDNTFLEWMDVTEDTSGWDVNLPDATGGAQGFSSIIVNTGAHSFTVNDNGDNVVQVIAAGESWLIWLKDNSTSDGSWQALQLGSTTSEASAGVLAGNGLTVIGLTLNQSHPVWDVSSNYTVVALQDRARLLLWTTGSGTITFPSSISLGDNWFTLIRNEGSASVTLDPNGSELIDGASTKSLAIGESCFVISDGSALYTVGYGRSVAYTETYVNINVAGSSNVTLTSSQFSSNIIRIFGVLTGDISLIVPAAVHTFIIVNATTGAHTVTVKVSGLTGVVAQQMNAQLLYCNGTDVFAGNTVNTISTGLFDNGTVTVPSISFTSNTNTGFFRSAANTIGVAAGGVLSALFNTVASGVNAFSFTPGATGTAAILGSYSGTDANVGITITPQGTGVVTVSSAATISGALTGSSTANIVGNFSIATNKFNVTAASGNTVVAGTLGVTGQITGNLTGNVTGNVSGSSGSTTGNAATATALATSRNFSITGSTGLTASTVGFDGTAAVALSLAGTLAVANGGTGQTSASNAINALLPSQTGNSGKYLTTNGAVASWIAPTINIQTFSSNGTYTPSAGMYYCVIECIGGGGAGGGVAGGSSSSGGGGGGGAGGYSRKMSTAATIGASKAVTIGAAGTAGSAGNNPGGNGGDTSVGVICIGKGGTGGFGSSAGAAGGGAGGVPGTGDVVPPGQYGSNAVGSNTSATYGIGGQGGSSGYGSGGVAPIANSVASAGNVATGYGCGGSGASYNNAASNVAGGNGSIGLVIITEYCSQ